MSTTLNKLEYLDETKGEIKNALNTNFNSGISENDTFRSYVSKINDIYTNWKKVTGEGTDLTLNNTKKGKMKLDLKGNTSQGENPSPENPQIIHTVTGDCEVEVVTENLFNPANIIEQKNCSIENDKITITDNSGWGQSYVFCGEKLYAGQYTFSIYGNSGTVQLYIRGYKDGEIYQKLINDFYSYNTYYKASNNGSFSIVSYKKSFTLPNDCDYYYVGFALGRNGTETVTVKVEKGTNDNPTYTPHAHQTFPISLGAIELCKIGDYQDYLYRENGNWYIKKNFGKQVLNGTEENITIYSQNVVRTIFSVPTTNVNTPVDSNVVSNIVSSHFIPVSQDAVWVPGNISVRTNFNFLYYTLASGETSESFKTWLTSNNVTSYYLLKSPTTTLITDTTLIAQLEAIENAMSYDEQTNISQTNDDLPFIISASALLKGGN